MIYQKNRQSFDITPNILKRTPTDIRYMSVICTIKLRDKILSKKVGIKKVQDTPSVSSYALLYVNYNIWMDRYPYI